MVSSSYHPYPEIKSLKLGRNDLLVGGNELFIQAVAQTLPLLTCLEELDCDLFENPPNFMDPLCRLLETSKTLKKLAYYQWNITAREASLFCSALANNSTLRDLSIHWSCIMPPGANYSCAFSASLEKSTILRTLVISSDHNYRGGKLQFITEAVGRTKSLVNFSLKGFVIDNEASAGIEDLLTGNCTLRRFEMRSCVRYPSPDEADHSYSSQDMTDVLSTRINSWKNILEKNRSLEELRLNLSVFSASEFRAFLAMLQNNTSLKRVEVEHIENYFYWRGSLTKSDSTQEQTDVSPPDTPDVIITQCQKLSHIGLCIAEKEDTSWFAMAMSALITCSHVTKLSISISSLGFDHEVEEVIANYIKNTRTLKELRLDLPFLPPDVTEEACRMKLIDALKHNSSLRKLFITNVKFTQKEAVFFTAMLQSSRKIYDLEIWTSKSSAEALVYLLSLGFSKNYTLVSLRWRYASGPDISHRTMHYYFVKDIVRRNHDFITRAAHCVIGNRNRRCSEALEVVSENPALIETVCELQSVGETQAAQIVRNTLGWLLSLDGFMRTTGVVKRRVCCAGSKDHKLQLDDLDEYSWLKVRRLLRIADVP